MVEQEWDEESLAETEKMIYIGFLFVRKLMESLKVTDSCKKSSGLVGRAKINPETEVTDFIREKAFDYIDQNTWKMEKVTAQELCDKIIHSFVFSPVQNEEDGGLAGFLYTSDRKKNSEVYLMPTETAIKIFQKFGNDYPQKIDMERDENGKIIYKLVE